MIDWSKAPEWANYVAMDEDGDWFWYELKPVQIETFWGACGGKCTVILEGKWKESLQERPKE